MGIDVLFCGLARTPELLLRSVTELAALRQRQLVDRIVFSTWKGQIDSHADLRRSLAACRVELVESEEPQYQGTSVFHQMRALELGLDHLDGSRPVFKTRADVYVRPEFLEKLAADTHYLEPERCDDHAVFQKKIWVPWFEITKPFYMGDECFFGASGDLRKLVNYDVSYDVKYDLDAGRGHIRRFIHPFLSHFPVLADYLRSGAKTQHNTSERFETLRRNMNSPAFWDYLAVYYRILKRYFRVESDYVSAQIVFRKWSRPEVTIDADRFDENFTVEKSWNGERGQIYAYNERWLDGVLNRRVTGGALAARFYEALSRCEGKHPSLLSPIKTPEGTFIEGRSEVPPHEANVRPKWEASITCEAAFWDKWLANRGRAGTDDFRMRTDPESVLQEHLARYIDMSLPRNRILDVGAGPLTIVNKKCPGTTLEIDPVDALADIYDRLLEKHRITPVVRTQKLDAEALTRKYGENTFDIAYSRNAIDHTYAPLQAVREMVKVTKPGGYVILQIGVEEGTRTHWHGLHSWNFSLKDHTLLLRGQKAGEFNVSDMLKDTTRVVDAGIEANMIRIVFQKTPCPVISERSGNRLDLCRFLQGMKDYVVLKLSEDFPNYRDHSDLDLLCGDCDRVLAHILEVGQTYEQQGFRIEVTATGQHRHVDFFAPGAKRLTFRFDLVDTLAYKTFEASSHYSTVVRDSAQSVTRGRATVRVPAPAHDLAIRFFEWVEHHEKRPDKIKHLNYVKAHYHPDFANVVRQYTSLKLTVATTGGGLDLSVSNQQTSQDALMPAARNEQALPACRSRLDYFLVWGHGLPYASRIIDILRNVKDLRIIIVVKKNVGDITRFVDEVYSCDTARLEHLRKKTRYLLQTEPEVLFILVENKHPQEALVGEGASRHIQCMFVKGIKEDIRNRFNPRKPDGSRTEHHVIHASDYQSQVSHMLKILGLRPMDYYTRRPNSDLDAPYHVEPFASYAIREVPIEALRANILEMGLVPISETPHYKYLTGDKLAYEQYHQKHCGTLLIEDHFPAAYDRLIADLKDDYRTPDGKRSLILVQSRRDGTYRILDGAHRAAILKHRGATKVTVAEPQREVRSPDTGQPKQNRRIVFLTVGCINYDCNINFYEPLKELYGDVINYNYMERMRQLGREAMNAEIVQVVQRERPDYVFFHTYQDQITFECLDELRRMGAKVAAWGSDDHWRFQDYSRLIGAHVFCSVTTDKNTVPKYQALGLNVVRSQWASNHRYYRKIDGAPIHEVTFVGNKYGKRGENLLYLQQHGVPLEVFGKRFGRYVTFDQMIALFSGSRINLNFTGSSRNDGLKQIKGRVFEVPMCGGFLLTEHVEGIEEYFDVGKEIECFRSLEEATEKIAFYLRHEELRQEIAERGYQRARTEHTWLKRLTILFHDLDRIETCPPAPQLSRQVNSEHPTIDFLLREARTCRRAGDFRRAIQLLEDAERRLHDQGVEPVSAVRPPDRTPVERTVAEEAEKRQRAQYYEVLNELGDCHTCVGSYSQAHRCYERASLLAPDEPGPYVGLGVGAIQKGSLEDAETAFQVACRLDPQCAEGYGGLAMVAQQRRDFSGAFDLYLKSLERDSNNVAVLLGFFQVSCEVGSFKEVICHLEKYLQLHSRETLAIFALAVSYQKTGRVDLCKSTLLNLLALNPADRDAANLLTEVEHNLLEVR
jgi:tetratricopeptide (TPR) repeat protein/SAM-dependent methyltransferase